LAPIEGTSPIWFAGARLSLVNLAFTGGSHRRASSDDAQAEVQCLRIVHSKTNRASPGLHGLPMTAASSHIRGGVPVSRFPNEQATCHESVKRVGTQHLCDKRPCANELRRRTRKPSARAMRLSPPPVLRPHGGRARGRDRVQTPTRQRDGWLSPGPV